MKKTTPPTMAEYAKALEITNAYIAFHNKPFVKARKCICCKKNKIKPLFNFSRTDALKQHKANWDGGAVCKITFGYGSKWDGDAFFIAICDDCITKLEKEGNALSRVVVKNSLIDAL